MDVVYPPKAPSGSGIFQSGGFGELRIGTLGNQDEYVEIDSDDSDAVPQIESGLRNDASVAGWSPLFSLHGASSCKCHRS